MANRNPSEPFKRAVAAAVRSLAGEPELEVNFSSEPPALKGLKARLPSPPRNLQPQEVALVRGVGDAYALRKAYHDEKLNAQLPAAVAEATAIFEAAENARVEAIGALAMEGVRAKSRRPAGTAAGGARAWAGRAASEEAPLADVVGLMVRESPHRRSAARPARRRGRSVAALHRGTRRQRSRQAARRDARPEGLCPPHPHHPQSISAMGDDSDAGRRRRRRRREMPRTRATGEEQESQEQGETGEAEFTEERGEEGEDADSRNAAREQSEDLADAEEAEDGMQAQPRATSLSPHQENWGYKIYTAAIRRRDFRARSLRRRGTDAPAQFPRSATGADAGRGVAAGQQAAAPAAGAAEPPLGIRSGRRHARYLAPAPHHHRSRCIPSPSSARRTPISATRW